MDIKQEMGLRLRAAREAKGFTLEALAAQVCGFGKSRISNYEQGLRMLRTPEAKALSKPLGVTPAFLLCVDEEFDLPLDERELLHNYRSSDQRGKRSIRIFAESQTPVDPIAGDKIAL